MADNREDVPLFHVTDFSRERFFELMSENRPCRISGITETWRASKEWVLNKQLNVNRIQELFGDCLVPVADCQRSVYGSQPKTEMSMKSYLNYWKSYTRPKIDANCWANTNSENCLYLKDWHMQRTFHNYEAYEVPEYFTSDWLNEFCLAGHSTDDYRFVYIGPRGSRTPLHCDVYGSYSWSANVCGEKLWLLLPPGDEAFYKDVNGTLCPDLTSVGDEKLYPRLHERGRPLKVVQRAGEAVFVPSGWHHQVLNTEDTVSINHNWFNGFNLEFIVQELTAAETAVKQELKFMEDDEMFADQVQVVLKAHHGMNRKDFQDILRFIATERLRIANDKNAIFDLRQCRKFLEDTSITDEISSLLNDATSSDEI